MRTGPMRRYAALVAMLVALSTSARVHVTAPDPEAYAESLLDAARAMAAIPYRPPSGTLPAPFKGLNYDAYRAIRPAAGRAAMLSLDQDFAADLLPPGLYFSDPVVIEWPAGDGSFVERRFALDLFDFDPAYFDSVPGNAPGAGFSGLRLRYPLNTASALDEFLVMQGGTYFRAIGRAMVYGLSARAVAIGTGGPTREEFPRFTRLRVHPPGANSIRLEAVFDSPSLAGHLDMTLVPGKDAAARITVTVMPRRVITDIGIAPLNSMYLKGPMRAAVSDDFRPRVHDSNLLLIENSAGEQLWRPLANPARVETSAFLDDGPAAFGLWQTGRRFEDYEDSEARYHHRPSARVMPDGDWGPGAVMLVEIPTDDEFLDNIVAFWRPAQPLVAGEAYRFAYRLVWTASPPIADVTPSILQSRSGREHDQPGTRRFVVDFAGPLTSLKPDLTVSRGATLSGLSLFALPGGRGTRVTFLLTPGERDSAELRLVLRDAKGRAASPVWLYRWTRARDGGV